MSGKWPMASKQWQVINGKWPVASDQWQVTNSKWPMASDQWPVISGQWPVASCQCPVASVQLPVSSCQWPMASDQWHSVSSVFIDQLHWRKVLQWGYCSGPLQLQAEKPSIVTFSPKVQCRNGFSLHSKSECRIPREPKKYSSWQWTFSVVTQNTCQLQYLTEVEGESN